MTTTSSLVGVQNLHYAVITKDDATGITYDAPKPLAPLVNVTVSTEVQTATQYADNKAIEVASAVGATTLSLELANLSTDVQADLLGLDKDSNGAINFTNEYKAPYVAIMFEGTTMTGKRMVVLYKGQFQYGEDAFATTTDQVSFNNKSVEATFISRAFDGKIKTVMDSNATNQAVIDAWYDAVYDGPVAP